MPTIDLPDINIKSCLVAMSGGVDSTVTALILKEKGVKVHGLYLDLLGPEFNENSEGQKENIGRIAKRIGIPLYIKDLRERFKKKVIHYFLDTYYKGLTPNPCVFCNPLIKFSTGLEIAGSLGLDAFATGHYVIIKRQENLGLVLKRAIDTKKDQSYFLYRLRPTWLSRIVFPLGTLSKEQVRQIARANSLDDLIMEESQEICFVKGDYRAFLMKASGIRHSSHPGPKGPGPIILVGTSEIVGTHNGIFNYTVGQRRGLGVPGPEPYYVVRIDTKKNAVFIAPRRESEQSHMKITHTNWLVDPKNFLDKGIGVKLRSRHHITPCRIKRLDTEEDTYMVELERPQRGVAPGQSAVFYLNDVVLGGGIICA